MCIRVCVYIYIYIYIRQADDFVHEFAVAMNLDKATNISYSIIVTSIIIGISITSISTINIIVAIIIYYY